MPRYKLTIEYDGTPFVGWQQQANGRAVQEAVADAVEKFSGERVTVHGAGRTDAGVHALAQVAHIDLAKAWDPDTVRDAINQHLRPEPATILQAEQAGDDFDARFSAVQRRYLYRIANRRAPLTLDANRAWRVPVDLDASAMHEAAQALVGNYDFTTFRSSECQAKSPVKTLDALTVMREGADIMVRAAARSFMHNQVRSMVGTLKLVGEGKWTTGDVEAALAAKDRAACGPVAPPHGLYLEAVEY